MYNFSSYFAENQQTKKPKYDEFLPDFLWKKKDLDVFKKFNHLKSLLRFNNIKTKLHPEQDNVNDDEGIIINITDQTCAFMQTWDQFLIAKLFTVFKHSQPTSLR